MARIQHIALAVEDPGTTADYYKRAFGFAELNRNRHGVWLTDGYIYFAILEATDQFRTTTSSGTGIHHFGVVVEDLEASRAAMEAEDAELTPFCTDNKPQYLDRDGICMDIRSDDDGFWDRRVGAVTQLMKLVPADS